MTEALAPLFEGKPIAVVEDAGELWFPVTDLAAAWGIDKNTLPHQIDRNTELFLGMHADKYVTYPTGQIQATCVNERGLYLLIGRINADRLKNPQAKEAILRFQRWVPELIQRYRKKEIVQVPATPEILPELRQAKEEAAICGCEPTILLAAVYRKHGEVEKANALVPAITRGEPGWYNPSGLVELCNDPNLTPERLNQYLANYRENGEWRPFQYREGKIWRLTKRGMDHGREYPFNLGNGHSEPRIAWRESILYASGLKHDLPASQATLPARAGVS